MEFVNIRFFFLTYSWTFILLGLALVDWGGENPQKKTKIQKCSIEQNLNLPSTMLNPYE